jgi:hypothetical protein
LHAGGDVIRDVDVHKALILLEELQVHCHRSQRLSTNRSQLGCHILANNSESGTYLHTLSMAASVFLSESTTQGTSSVRDGICFGCGK